MSSHAPEANNRARWAEAQNAKVDRRRGKRRHQDRLDSPSRATIGSLVFAPRGSNLPPSDLREEPLLGVEIKVSTVADFQHNHRFRNVHQHLVLIIKTDADVLFSLGQYPFIGWLQNDIRRYLRGKAIPS